MNAIAGIVWDPREPPPPELLRAGHGHFHHGVHHRRERRGRPAPRPAPPAPHHEEVADFVIREPTRNILPPFSISLKAQIVQDTAKVTVTQLFWNKSDTIIGKGAYTFPLPSGCTVTEFSCRVGRNKIIRAKVKPKEEARQAFQNAINNNRTAGLLEQDTPEIFTTCLGNIPANTKLKAEISFITLLKHRFVDPFSTTTLTIPTYIAGRYGTPPPEFQDATSTSIPQGLSIQIEVVAAENVPEILSKTHRITVERGVARRNVQNWEELAGAYGTNNVQTSLVMLEDGSAFLDKDLVLDIATEPQNGLEAPQAWLEEHPSFENHKAVMLTIPPSFMLGDEGAAQDGEVLFVADRSGSMIDKMESLKSAMQFFLKGIPQGRKFNIWCFGTNHMSLWPKSVDYSNFTLQAALNFVSNSFRADMGGTELLPALEAIARARDPSCMTDIVVLTDGEVWRLNETLDFVQRTRSYSEGMVRLFALGVGNAVSHALVEGIAKAGGGYAEVIPAASKGGWEDRVVAMVRAALARHVGPPRIEFDRDTEQANNGMNLNSMILANSC